MPVIAATLIGVPDLLPFDDRCLGHLVSPFQGWLVFEQVPDAFVIAGALVVVVSGLYLLWMELRRR